MLPGSHAFDAAVSDRERQQTLPRVKVAVPRGTVTVYALHTMHRGSANTHTDDRPFYFFTLLGEGLAPPGGEAEALALPRAAGDGVYIVVPYLLGLVVDAGAPRGADIALAGVAGVLGAVAVFVALPSRGEEKIG